MEEKERENLAENQHLKKKDASGHLGVSLAPGSVFLIRPRDQNSKRQPFPHVSIKSLTSP